MNNEVWSAWMSQEATVRVAVFGAVFVLLAWVEWWLPRRALTLPRLRRWPANVGLVLLNTALVRLVFPTAVAGAAAWGAARGWGLLPVLALPPWLAVVLAVVALDGVIWAQHVLMHRLPWLWRLHQVHHADPDMDLTTALRFHPLEIGVSLAIKSVAVLLLGAPVLAVLWFEVLLNAAALFSHSNIRLPVPLDTSLRWLLVTPDMHRVHHSTALDESGSNFGFQLSLWDRMLGTYRAQPRLGHTAMPLGLEGHSDTRQTAQLLGMLRMPFQRQKPSSTAP
jgi:sterol desaturase/sphingolipid hydroxylase (fatty acid hydroxylase superfamily)